MIYDMFDYAETWPSKNFGKKKRGHGYDAIRKKQFWSNSVSLIINHMVENWQKDASSVESVGTSFPFLISHYIHVQKTAASC